MTRFALPWLALLLVLAVPAPAAAQQAAAWEPLCRRMDRPPPRPDTGYAATVEDLGHGTVFRCTLRRGGPVRTVRLGGNGGPQTLRIERPDGVRLQSFGLGEANQEPGRGSRFFRALDLNGDGWTDLAVLLAWGVHGEEYYAVFRYDPVRRRFVRDTVLAGKIEPGRGRGCVSEWSRGAFAMRQEDFCWRRGRWQLTRDERTEWNPDTRGGVPVVRTRRALRGGHLRVVAVDTLREGGR